MVVLHRREFTGKSLVPCSGSLLRRAHGISAINSLLNQFSDCDLDGRFTACSKISESDGETWTINDNVTAYAAYKEGYESGGFSNNAILSNLSPPLMKGSPCISRP